MKRTILVVAVVALTVFWIAGISVAKHVPKGAQDKIDYYVKLEPGTVVGATPLLTDVAVQDGYCGTAVINERKGQLSGRFGNPPGSTGSGCLVPYPVTSTTGVSVVLDWAAWAGGGGFDDQGRLVAVWFAFNDVPNETNWPCNILDVAQPAIIPEPVGVNGALTCTGNYSSGHSGPDLGTISVDLGTMFFRPAR